MARPALVDIDAPLGGWVSRLNANFDKLVDTPFPIATTATTTTLDSEFDPKLYKNCLIVVEADNLLYESDGTNWKTFREQVTFQADFTSETITQMKTYFNGLLAELITKKWMASS